MMTNQFDNQTILGAAEQYEPTVTKNIADFGVFDVHMSIYTKNGVTKQGESFSYKYVLDKNGVEYRVPDSVLKMLKEYVREAPGQKFFKVTKTGAGLKTSYNLIAVHDR